MRAQAPPAALVGGGGGRSRLGNLSLLGPWHMPQLKLGERFLALQATGVRLLVAEVWVGSTSRLGRLGEQVPTEVPECPSL